MSTENIQQQQQQPEENATSDKRIELATQHINAKRAEKEARLAEKRMKREQFRLMSPEERWALRGQKRSEREERKATRQQVRQQVKAERFAKIQPESQAVVLERQQKRQWIMSLPSEERKAYYRDQEKTEVAGRLESEREVRLARRTAKQEDILSSKILSEVCPGLSGMLAGQGILPEQQQVFTQYNETRRKERIEASDKRTARWMLLANSWTDQIPDNLELLIVDGNNLRGGGPKRISRDAVVELLSKRQWTNLVAKQPNGETSENSNNKKPRIVCVFDHEASNISNTGDIEIQFSKDVIADDVIAQLAEQNKDKSTLVVTCDRDLALRILDLGGKIMRNRKFESLIV